MIKKDIRHNHNLLKLMWVLLLMSPMFCLLTSGQRITVKGPTSIATGQRFQIQYVVNTTDVSGFRIGNVPDAFDVIYGPSTSTQQSFSMVNGHTSQSSSVTYTYTLIAKKNGTFVIPSAHANVSGKSVSSQALKINVSGKPQQSTGQNVGNNGSAGQRVDRAGSRISGNDLFIRVTANKQRVYEQEPVLLTYKVYTQVELTQLEGKMPDLNGFHTQEIPLPQQKSFHIETLGGKTYRCVTWSQYVMFPQISGKLEIPSITFKGIVVQENTNVDPFEAFFNGGAGYVEVKKEIKAPSVQIQVMPLPSKPANFSGGVGYFNVSSSLDKKTVKAGEPVSLRVVVSGAGNMKLLKMPEIALPKDFDKYDPKLTDNTKLSINGVEGNMVYDYLIVPRNKGSYTIPAIEFTYFDTKSSTYKTAKTTPINLTVEQGDGKNGATVFSQENDNDISDLIPGEPYRENANKAFFGSKWYIVTNIIVLLVFIALLVVFRKRALAMADVTAVRSKKADKVAVKRLSKAEKLMNESKRTMFYDEVLRTLWGYVGDKLSIPVEQLSRDNIQEKLRSNNVEDNLIDNYIEAIDECEYARYAPSDDMDSKTSMQKTYNKAKDAISKLTLTILMIFSFVLSAGAVSNTAEADAAYRSGDYQKAIKLYSEDLKEGESAKTYHNLGNCYYRTDSINKAVLCYERARKYSPANKKILHSLEIAQSKTIDRLPSETDVFYLQWYRGLQSVISVNAWTYIAVGSLILSLLLFLSYLFARNIIIRRFSFYFSVTLFVFSMMCNLFAWQRKSYLLNHDMAIVTEEMITVKASPTEKSKDVTLLHEGTVMSITDKDIRGWYAIKLSDGREGWVQTKDIEEI